MGAVLVLLGVSLVVAGFLWRLREIGEGTMARAPGGGTGGAVQPQRSSASKRTPKSAGAGIAQGEASHATAPGASAMAQSLRRSDRILLEVPLQVSGIDLEGKPFTERTHTLVINRNGASVALRNTFRPEVQLTVKNLQTGQWCRFRACPPSQELPGGFREWGVECLDPAPNFWGITFAESPEEPAEETVGSLLECTGCHCREMVKLTLPEYRTIIQKASSARYCVWCGTGTEWKFTIVEEDAEATASPSLKVQEDAGSLVSGVERRREERRIARMPISMRYQDGREEFTITENVSKSGVCCAANMEIQVGDHVFLKLVSEDRPGDAEFRAQIMWRRKINEKRGFLYGIRLEREQSPPA